MSEKRGIAHAQLWLKQFVIIHLVPHVTAKPEVKQSPPRCTNLGYFQQLKYSTILIIIFII